MTTMNKIKNELGWKMDSIPSQQIDLVIKWYIENKKWWKKIKNKKEFNIRYIKQKKSQY